MAENSIGEQFRQQVLGGLKVVDSDISAELLPQTRKFLLEDRITNLARTNEGLNAQTSGFNALRRGLFYGAATGLALTLGSPEAGMVVGGTLLSLDLLRRGAQRVTSRMLGLLQETRVGQLDELNRQESSAPTEAIASMQAALAQLEAAYRPTLTILDENERKRIGLEHAQLQAAVRRNEKELSFDLAMSEYIDNKFDSYRRGLTLGAVTDPGFITGWKDALRQQGMNEKEILLHLLTRYRQLQAVDAPIKDFVKDNIEKPLKALGSSSP